jgi:hypothetical protein
MNRSNLVIAVVLGISFIVGSWFISTMLKKKNETNDVIEVTGLAEENFSSDLIVWTGSFNRLTMDLKESYKLLKTDENVVKTYLKEKGISDNEMVFSSVAINQDYEYVTEPGGGSRRIFNGYRLVQTVRIESKDVPKIEKISREVTELIDRGVELNSDAPAYYYTKLADLKIKMIANATKDARERAEKVAENAKAKLGQLQQADMGIFQITAQNSSEEYSWGGTLNTTSKEKTASITMKLKFSTH